MNMEISFHKSFLCYIQSICFIADMSRYEMKY